MGPKGCLAYGVLPQALAFQKKEEQGNHITLLPLNIPPTSDHSKLRGFPESVAVYLFSNLKWITFSGAFPVFLWTHVLGASITSLARCSPIIL